jgi:hypothetical protein
MIHEQDDCEQLRSNVKADLIVVTGELKVRAKVEKRVNKWIKKLKDFREGEFYCFKYL